MHPTNNITPGGAFPQGISCSHIIYKKQLNIYTGTGYSHISHKKPLLFCVLHIFSVSDSKFQNFMRISETCNWMLMIDNRAYIIQMTATLYKKGVNILVIILFFHNPCESPLCNGSQSYACHNP